MSHMKWANLSDEEILVAVASPAIRTHVVGVMNTLTPDPIWTERIVAQLLAEDRGPVAETRCILAWLSATIQPKNYLEIGVRRGFSSAMVASKTPTVNIYGFDLWIQGYAGSENPGPNFVAGELQKVGHRGRCVMTSGNSHETVPEFFRPVGLIEKVRRWASGKLASPPESFDLITVDGDHSLVGAYDDLLNVMGRCAVGGAIVFDDIAPDLEKVGREAIRQELGADPNGHESLQGVWNAMKVRYPNFRYLDYTAHPPGVGIAFRVS